MNLIGIDVSNDTLDASRANGQEVIRRQFSNTPGGYRQFIQWALHGSDSARVCLEATGIYHLQLALALDQHPAIELMVVNPRAARRFAEAHMVRAKTDAIDADGLLLFVQRMPFRPWVAPRDQVLQLQSLAHRVAQLDKELSRERSRLHAARKAGPHTRPVQQDIQAHLKQLQRRKAAMQARAEAVIQHDTQLAADARLIDSVPGFAARSTSQLMAELAPLASDMTAAQWVAQAGLDPKPGESGTSVRAPRQISKQGNARIRAALFMPALVAIQHDAHVTAFYEKLLAKGKTKMTAITAVMRKLLHALWGMLHLRQVWDGEKFYRLNLPQTA
jgi:transposase